MHAFSAVHAFYGVHQTTSIILKALWPLHPFLAALKSYLAAIFHTTSIPLPEVCKNDQKLSTS